MRAYRIDYRKQDDGCRSIWVGTKGEAEIESRALIQDGQDPVTFREVFIPADSKPAMLKWLNEGAIG